ncbi:MAG TPA: peptidylprolyl isomerase [Hanamia sp.]|nr:peptidylprolyl isomerase [Hanamia sp.]
MKKLFYLISFAFFISCTASKNSGKSKNATVFVKIETDSGTMVAKLYNKTPLYKEDFVKLVKKHFYDGLLFHRVIPGFIIQGGDPESRDAKPGQVLGSGGSKKTIPAEFDTSLFHKKGALGMARETDDINPQKASSSIQFYIVEGRTFTNLEMNRIEEQFHIKIPENHREVYRTIGGAPFLDMNYTVFGEVVSGLGVIDKIAHAPKDKNNRPLQDIRMKITLMKRSEYRKYL